jgi:hypothetical protein
MRIFSQEYAVPDYGAKEYGVGIFYPSVSGDASGRDALGSVSARKRVGSPFSYGVGQYAFSHYGVEPRFSCSRPYGTGPYGGCVYGDHVLLDAVYQMVMVNRRRIAQRVRYSVPLNPQSVPQEANREKFGDAVVGWQALSEPQREVYRDRAVGRNMSGYNLYLREQMLNV